MTSHIGVQRLLHYDRRDLRGDLMGGVTVTAYLIPQVMAYSALAGLAPQAGLAVIVVAMVLYAMVGSSRLLSVGPESTTALMTAAVLAPLAAGDPVRYAALAAMLAMLVGLYALLSGVLRLGFIGDLLSRPVLIGYMAGVAVIMISSQLGKVTGVDVAGDTFVEDIGSFAGNTLRDGVSWPTLAIGAAVAGLLLFFTPRYPKVPVPLVVMLLATAVVAVFDLTAQGVTTVGDVSFDGMNVGLPSLDTTELGILLLPALGIFVVGYTDNILTARAFATRSRTRVHNNQEFLAMGTANVGSSLVGGFPVSSSASRTSIAEASGARSQLYSLVAAVLTIIAVVAFSSVIAAFPAAALGGVVDLRRDPADRRRRVPPAVAVPPTGVPAGHLRHGGRAAVRHPVRRARRGGDLGGGAAHPRRTPACRRAGAGSRCARAGTTSTTTRAARSSRALSCSGTTHRSSSPTPSTSTGSAAPHSTRPCRRLGGSC